MSGPVALCTDSSALLPADLAARLGVDVVPVGVSLDGRAYDDADLDADRFYAQLARGGRATTSQPSPARFADAYARAAARGAGEVLSIHVASAVSGTIGSAVLAAHEAPLPVTVVDTGTVSFGVAACTIAAAETLGAGGSARDAVAAVERLGRALRNAFVAGGAPGGRVSAGNGLAVFRFAGARAELVGPVESLEQAAALMATETLSADEPIAAAVGHADAATAAAADTLADALRRSCRVVEVLRYRVGPSVGAHTGRLTFGAFWWPA